MGIRFLIVSIALFTVKFKFVAKNHATEVGQSSFEIYGLLVSPNAFESQDFIGLSGRKSV